MGYYVNAELFYGVKVYSELPDFMDEYSNGKVFGRNTGCAASGDHNTDWLTIGQSQREVLEGREVTEPIVISELETNPEWDDLLLHYAQELGVKALTSPSWVVVSNGG